MKDNAMHDIYQKFNGVVLQGNGIKYLNKFTRTNLQNVAQEIKNKDQNTANVISNLCLFKSIRIDFT